MQKGKGKHDLRGHKKVVGKIGDVGGGTKPPQRAGSWEKKVRFGGKFARGEDRKKRRSSPASSTRWC